MITSELLNRAESALRSGAVLVLTPEEFASITPAQIDEVQGAYGSRLMLRLPEHEITFFEWLRQADPPVWADLWSDAVDSAEPYTVSLAFLNDFAGTADTGAYLICDLRTTDNYFFLPSMLLEKESTDFVDAVRTRFLGGGSLSPEQALTVEISAGPTDIWHFAFRRGVDLDRAKTAVARLVEDRIIVHVPSAEHLSTFFGEE